MKTAYFLPIHRYAVVFSLILSLCSLGNAFAETPAAETPTTQRGTLAGGVQYETPAWFKDSFLDIQDDVDEAKAAGKHVLLFFHLNDCPYCERMLRESFSQEPLQGFIQQHFDVIGINIKGDREIAFDKETSLLEKELAEKIKVEYTPTILFLDGKNDAVARLNGYRSPARFKTILEYVQSKAYEKGTLADYVATHQPKDVYTLRDNPLFKTITDFSAIKTPLAVIFEDNACDECSHFHDKLLSRPDVQTELKALTVVRLDANSTDAITDTDGKQTTAKDWAKTLDMLYRPGVVLFDGGKEVQRIDGMLYSFHFKELIRYVGGGFHKTATMRDYMRARQEELLAAGININLAE